MAFVPQVPGHGSLHLFCIHALFLGQSLFNTHSGLHPTYGSPWNSILHLQIPLKQSAFGPHGDGLHGSENSGSGTI